MQAKAVAYQGTARESPEVQAKRQKRLEALIRKRKAETEETVRKETAKREAAREEKAAKKVAASKDRAKRLAANKAGTRKAQNFNVESKNSETLPKTSSRKRKAEEVLEGVAKKQPLGEGLQKATPLSKSPTRKRKAEEISENEAKRSKPSGVREEFERSPAPASLKLKVEESPLGETSTGVLKNPKRSEEPEQNMPSSTQLPTRSAAAPVGLDNYNQACFANSVLQCLDGIPELVDFYRPKANATLKNEACAISQQECDRITKKSTRAATDVKDAARLAMELDESKVQVSCPYVKFQV